MKKESKQKKITERSYLLQRLSHRMKHEFIWLHLITFVERIIMVFLFFFCCFCFCSFFNTIFWNDDNYRKHHLNLDELNWNWTLLGIFSLNLWSIFLDFNYGSFLSWVSIGNCQVSLGFFLCARVWWKSR